MIRGARTWAGVAVSFTALLVAACSSGGSSTTDAASNGAGSSTSSAAAATGSAIKLMIVGIENNPIYSAPESFEGAQAAVDAINAAGGVNGHKLTLITCNNELDPNAEEACISEAASDHVSALVGSYFNFGDFAPIQKAQIPLILNQGIAPSEYTSSVSYTIGANVVWFESLGGFAAKEGAKSAAIAYIGTSAGKFSGELMQNSADRAGIKVTTVVGFDPNATDFSSYAAILTKGNPDALLVSGTSENVVPLIQAVKQGGYTGKIFTIDSDLPPSGLKTLGSAGDGIYVDGRALFPTDTSNPEVAAYLADINKYEPGTVLDENSEMGWSGVETYAELMKNATAFTGPDVIAALSKLTSPIQAGVFGPFIGSGTAPDPTYPRLLSAVYVTGQVENGVIKPINGTFLSTFQK
jgi:branched-chain amino acid transport system substrate-binding protein